MAVSDDTFPPRKRRPEANSFVPPPPNLPDQKLLQSLLFLSHEISDLHPFRSLLKRSSSSIIRKTKLLSVLFEELLRCPAARFPPSALLCFEELHIILQRIGTLIEDFSNGSKMWLLMQNQSAANSFHELTAELSTLLDVFPARDLDLSEDVRELIALIKKQCSRPDALVDPADEHLRIEVLITLDRIKKEIVPDHSKLEVIFDRLGLRDSSSCRDEIESLQDEAQNQTDEKSRADVISLIGLVRYAKCVLYGASTPRNAVRRRRSAGDLTFPSDFRCPISLELMKEPVVVSTGQTYDRASIVVWIESGHNTCPKTGQILAHTELIPNHALKNLIALWCREQKIPFEATEQNVKSHGVYTNKTALEATKMTVSFLVSKLASSHSTDAANRIVHELRALAKTDSDSRACISEAGALPLLVKYIGSENPSLQTNAVTTILNLSILGANKARIMETDGVLNGVIEVLRSGGSWEAKGNAAATIFSLTTVQSYKRALGRKTRVVKGLIDLARDGPTNTKRDAMVAILSLAGDRETAGKLVDGGVVEMVGKVVEGMPEEGVTILEAVVRKGGLGAIAAAYKMIEKLGRVLREGSERARESAAATLVNICRKGGSEMVAEVAAIPGIERVVWEMMGVGTGRGRRKAASLLRLLRRWAAGLDADVPTSYSSTALHTMALTSTTIVLPA